MTVAPTRPLPHAGERDGPPEPALDLRLATVAAAAWIAVLLLGGRGVPTVATSAALAVIVTVGVALRRHRGRARPDRPGRVVVLVGLVAAGLALVLAPLAVRLAGVQASPLLQVGSDGPVAVSLVVTGDARPLRSSGVSAAVRVAVDARATAVLDRGRRVPLDVDVLVLAPSQGWIDLVPGQPVEVDATARAPYDDPLLGAVLSVQRAPSLVGRPPGYQRVAAHVRLALRAACAGLPAGPRGLLPGLVVGDTSGVDPVLADRFRTAGLTHLLAVSGTNCAIIVGAAVLLARRCRAGPRLTAVIAGVLLVGFVVVARPSPSVVRAAVMAAIGLAALATGRRRAVVPALAAAVLAGLLWRPQLAHDPGFTMSVLATGAIVLLAPPFADRLRRARVPRGLAEALAVAALAHLVTAPVAVLVSGQFSLVAIPANVAAEPVVAAATILGFVAALLAAASPALGAGPAWLASWPCRWLIAVAERFGTAPGATVGWGSGWVAGWSLLAVLTAVVALVRWRRTRRVLLAGLVAALLVQIPGREVLSTWPPTGWWFVACDVGQGDGLVLAAGAHTAVVVDTGPDPVAMDACLRGLGVDRVPLLLITHLHQDHVGGIDGVFHGRTVGAVMTGPLLEPVGGLAEAHADLDAHGLTLLAAPVGHTITVGAVRLEFLGPRVAFLGTRSDPNNSSVVVRATVGGKRVLLSADEEIEAQDALLASGVDLSADVLKIPHHGSAWSDPAFLAAAHARLGVVSVGVDNDYGHPAPSTMAALGRLGMTVARTDLDGSVAVSTDASGQLVVTTQRSRPAVPAAMSGLSVRMAACHPPAAVPLPARVRRSPPPTASTTSPALFRSPRSSSCSVTRSSWSRAPPRPSSRRYGTRSPPSRWSTGPAWSWTPPRSPRR